MPEPLAFFSGYPTNPQFGLGHICWPGKGVGLDGGGGEYDEYDGSGLEMGTAVTTRGSELGLVRLFNL